MRIPVPDEILPAAELGRVHCVGIGGAGISAIARIMAARGIAVTGSDDHDTPFLPALRELGVTCHLGYDAAHVGDADTLVVTTAAREDNPEVLEARRRGLRILPRSAGLAAVMAGLPGAYDRYDIPGMRKVLARYDEISHDDLRANLIRFLEAVIPTAEEVGVRMCIHPDDPPRDVFGLHFPERPVTGSNTAPILITGATGTLGRAFARICAERDLHCRVLTRAEMDITDPASIEAALERFKPWAVINTAGYVRVDDAERDAERCFRENTAGPANLAADAALPGGDAARAGRGPGR